MLSKSVLCNIWIEKKKEIERDCNSSAAPTDKSEWIWSEFGALENGIRLERNWIGSELHSNMNQWNLAGFLCRLHVDNGETTGTGSAGELALPFCLTTPFCFPLLAPVSTANQLCRSFAANLPNPSYQPVPIRHQDQLDSAMLTSTPTRNNARKISFMHQDQLSLSLSPSQCPLRH